MYLLQNTNPQIQNTCSDKRSSGVISVNKKHREATEQQPVGQRTKTPRQPAKVHWGPVVLGGPMSPSGKEPEEQQQSSRDPTDKGNGGGEQSPDLMAAVSLCHLVAH